MRTTLEKFVDYKPPTCVLQLSEAAGHAGQDDLADLMGHVSVYYNPATCVLQLFQATCQAGQDNLADFLGAHFFYFRLPTCVQQRFETPGQTGQDNLSNLVVFVQAANRNRLPSSRPVGTASSGSAWDTQKNDGTPPEPRVKQTVAHAS